MEEMNVFDKLSTPPESALRRIQAGRLKGKTDINPQWRYRAMTEQFGLCGVGWKYCIDERWTENGDNDQVMAFVKVSLYIKVGGEWSDAIPGTGGSMLVTKETKGLYSSDEAYKMATTDALSVAMKMIGVASQIYEGNYDGSKYVNQATENIDIEALVIQLETAGSMKELQERFLSCIKLTNGNKSAQDRLIKIKDQQKAALNGTA